MRTAHRAERQLWLDAGRATCCCPGPPASDLPGRFSGVTNASTPMRVARSGDLLPGHWCVGWSAGELWGKRWVRAPLSYHDPAANVVSDGRARRGGGAGHP